MTHRPMIFRRFTVGRYPINGYLVADPESRIAVFIDPGGFREEIAAFIDLHQLDLRHLFFTHGHWDHTEGLPEFQKRYSVQGHAGPDEVKSASFLLHGHETIEVGRLRFTVLPTPGHTHAGRSFFCHDRVFTGDALFCGSVGGTASPADHQTQLDSVRTHLFPLPPETLVFPAHGPLTTIAAEKYANPFFR